MAQQQDPKDNKALASDLIKLYQAITEQKKEESKAPKSKEVDETLYCDINEVADILQLSIYRIRQMYWEGRFKDTKKGEKKVYISRAEVVALKRLKETKVVRSTVLSDARTQHRLEKSVEVLKNLVKADSRVNPELKRQITELMGKYETELGKKNK